mmetsp:Transcript_69880/g.164428  ORF Transcript_69880/g.164428 Transcript_69880/m.164428 type:complete len:255 (+) Transcript_69880:385-1149(+)
MLKESDHAQPKREHEVRENVDREEIPSTPRHVTASSNEGEHSQGANGTLHLLASGREEFSPWPEVAPVPGTANSSVGWHGEVEGVEEQLEWGALDVLHQGSPIAVEEGLAMGTPAVIVLNVAVVLVMSPVRQSPRPEGNTEGSVTDVTHDPVHQRRVAETAVARVVPNHKQTPHEKTGDVRPEEDLGWSGPGSGDHRRGEQNRNDEHVTGCVKQGPGQRLFKHAFGHRITNLLQSGEVPRGRGLLFLGCRHCTC